MSATIDSSGTEQNAAKGMAAMLALNDIDYRGYLRRRWPLMAVFLVLGIALSVVYWSVARLKYESKAQILIMKKDAKLPTRGAEGAGEEDANVGEDLLATHMQILHSPAIVRSALLENGLDELPSIVAELNPDEKADQYVIDHLYVTRGGLGQARTAHVLNVAFRHTSDEDCELILNAIIDSYQKFLNETFQDVSTEAVSLIMQAKDELGRDLDKAEDNYRAFREGAPLLWDGEKSENVHRNAFKLLQEELAEQRMRYAAAESRLQVVEAGLEDMRRSGTSEFEQLALLDELDVERLKMFFEVDAPTRTESSRAEFDQLMRMMMRERSLLLEYGAEHPTVRELRHHINVAQGMLSQKSGFIDDHKNRKFGKSQNAADQGSKQSDAGSDEQDDAEDMSPSAIMQVYLRLLNSDLTATIKRIERLEVVAETEREAAQKLVSYELRDEALQKNLERKQDLFDMVIERLREINIVKEYNGFVTEVIEPVELGEQVWPRLIWCLLIGSTLGLLAGVGAGTVAELRDQTFHGPEEIRQSLGLPILTHVPRLDTSTVLPSPEGLPPVDPTIVVYHQPRSREAEAFRALRTSIFFSAREATRQVLEFTSANPGDGKTTTACNLAVGIAQTGRKVLIIDCDMRRPRIHEVFRIGSEVGLSSVVAGAAEPPDAIHATGVVNLSAMAAGPIPENPAELLTSAPFGQLIGALRQQFDFIVLDTPPLLAVADASIVAQLADGVVMTVRTTNDSRPQAIEAKELLTRVDAKVLGLVVNVADEGSAGYSIMHGKGYGYQHTAYGSKKNAGYYHVGPDKKSRKAAGRTS
ncbi:MAG TPA: polysaccharide biosynthesis tyrosine autokinase [Pirellulales bacterium]|nr:polysaccharide biosynthesis tyrosine autokinase [Pirellulales bacterium]